MDDKQTDQIILDKRQSGDYESAFELIVSNYSKKIYWLIRRMVIDHDDATDLTQEVMIKVWDSFRDFKGESKIYTWLYRVASNEALSHLRKKRRRFFLPIHDVEAELEGKLESNLNQDAEQIQMDLQKAILTLPEKQRLVFQLRYFDEMPYEDMSQVTGTSVGALKASYHLAQKKVEQYLKSTLNQ